MKTFIYGKYNIGDKIILSYIQNTLKDSEYLGEKVDLSRIEPSEENLIIISNTSLFNIDLDKVLAYIKKDVSRPMVVVKKIKTFGTLFFKENFEVEKITTNKSYLFAGIMYLPKKYLLETNKNYLTISNIFKTVPYLDWNVFIINGRRQ